MTEVRSQIFISYSHKDRKWLDMLQTNLKPLIRGGEIKLWDDTRINAGSLWREEIGKALATAKAAVLLVSPDFLASDFISAHELPRLLEAAKDKDEGLKILWLAVRWSMYQNTEIERYQALNDPLRPLAEFSGALRDKALVQICERIKEECAWEELVRGGVLAQAAQRGGLPAAAEVAENSRSAQVGLEALIKLMSDAAVREDVGKFEAHFHSSAKQIGVLGYYKDLHDELHTLQLQCYQRLTRLLRDVKSAPNDSSPWEDGFELEMIIEEVRWRLDQLADPEVVSQRGVTWVPKLIGTLHLLPQALRNCDVQQLEKALGAVGRILRVEPDRLNSSLREAARALPLGELVVSLSRVCDRLDRGRATPDAVDSLKEGVAALGKLASRLDSLIEQHDRWQTLDVELMREEAEGLAELAASWPDLKKDAEVQCQGRTEEWVRLLTHDAEKLTRAIAAQEPNQIKQYFRSFRNRVVLQFYQADLMVKKVCEELSRAREPLAKVQEMIK
jgi:hypothetical protein